MKIIRYNKPEEVLAVITDSFKIKEADKELLDAGLETWLNEGFQTMTAPEVENGVIYDRGRTLELTQDILIEFQEFLQLQRFDLIDF